MTVADTTAPATRNPFERIFVALIDPAKSERTMLILLAGLKSLPKEPYEAAILDGASKRQVFTSITLPLLTPQIVVCITFGVMDLMRAFDLIFVLTRGGPGISTETLNFYAYIQGFQYLEMGYGATIVYALMLLIVLVSAFLVRPMVKK